MEFLLSFWPQLLILLALIIIAVILLRRLPHVATDVVVADPTALQRKPEQGKWRQKLKAFWVKTVAVSKNVLRKLRDFVMQKRRKQEAAAVSGMFEPTAPSTAAPVEPMSEAPKPTPSLTVPTPAAPRPNMMQRTVRSLRLPVRKPAIDPAEQKAKVDELLRRAAMYAKENRIKDAEETYIKAVTLDPHNPVIYQEMAAMYLATGNVKDGRAALAEAVKQNSKDPELHTKLGILAAEQGDLKAALLNFEHALNLDRKNAVRHAAVAEIFVKMGDQRNAFKFFSDAYKLNGLRDYGLAAFSAAKAMDKIKKAKEIVVELFAKYPEDFAVREAYKEAVGPIIEPETAAAPAPSASLAPKAQPMPTTPTTPMPVKPMEPPAAPHKLESAPTSSSGNNNLKESLKAKLGIKR